jgi:hypothetical protein
MRFVFIIVITLWDAVYRKRVMFVMVAMVSVVAHRGLLSLVLVFAHLFLVPLRFVMLLRRCFLSED